MDEKGGNDNKYVGSLSFEGRSTTEDQIVDISNKIGTRKSERAG